MKKLVGLRSFMWLGILLCTVASLASAADQSGVTTINGGRKTVYVKPAWHSNQASTPLPAGVITIYSNLGTGDKAYNGNAGVGILGPDAGQPWPQEVGSTFTPKADHIVQAVRVGATYVQGTNGIVVSLNEDDNGVPGKQLASGKFTNLPTFGSCCTLQTGKGKSGIPVKANTTYWIVLRPIANDTYAVWNDNYNEIQGHWANNLGSGWNGSFQVLGAFGVYGQ